MAQYMVEIRLPQDLPEAFIARIPAQIECVNELMTKRKIISYTLNAERSMLWTVVQASSEAQVMEIIGTFPLIRWMKPEVHELMFHYESASLLFPRFSLN
jgi:muconolactone delta-isomerase